MDKFNKKRKFGGGGKFFGKDRGFNKNQGGRPEMHQATCSECGQSCEVPFRPTGERPVFCNNCFASKRGTIDRPNNFVARNNWEKPRFENRTTPTANIAPNFNEQFKSLGEKLDKIIKLLTPEITVAVPAEEKPIKAKEAKKVKAKAKSVVKKAKTVKKKK